MTKLPNESDGNTVQSGRWNTILGKIQESTDTDVTIRGRKATFGTFVSLSAASFVGLSGAAGYYGVRAEDHITSGDGSAANPYNASAIQSAINALPSRGGIVFIKEGVWRGTSRITVNAAGTEKNKHVLFQGAGTFHRQIFFKDGSSNILTGTHVQAGFDCYIPCDFYDMAISPHPNNFGTQPCVDFIIDPTKNTTEFDWTGGHTVKRIRFWLGTHGVRYRGVNMGAVFVQIWGVVYEQCGFIEQETNGFRMVRTDFDSTAPSQGIRMALRNCEFRGVNGRGFNYDVSSSALLVEDCILEGCGSIGGDYAFFVNTFGDGGVYIHNIDFGDGAYSNKCAKLDIGRGANIDYFRVQARDDTSTAKNEIDIGGRGHFRIGGDSKSGSPFRFNLVNMWEGTIEEANFGSGSFGLGTVDALSQSNAARITIRPQVTPPGLIGSTTPGASPHTYTNLDMYEEMVYLVGGTISDVSRDGTTIGTDRSHYMRPGDSIVITYSSAPTIKRFGVGMS